MTYRWRAGETDVAVEYAPYVLREKVVPDPSKCGTIQGYQQHLYYGQEACPDCKAARKQRSANQRAGREAEC